jgi:hypothetical protein
MLKTLLNSNYGATEEDKIINNIYEESYKIRNIYEESYKIRKKINNVKIRKSKIKRLFNL